MIFLKDITIGILTYKRNILLENLLSSLCSNIALIEGVGVPVVVVDNSGEDLALEVVERFKDANEINMTFVSNQERQTIPQGRNNIIKEAKTDWLLILDDDQWLRDDFLRDLQEALSAIDLTHYPVIKLGIQTIDEDGNTENLENRDIPHAHNSEFDGINCASGGVLLDMQLVRSKEMKFDNQWSHAGGEDSAFFYQFQELDKRCWSLKDLKVYEVVVGSRQGFSAELRSNIGKGYTNSRLAILILNTRFHKVMIDTFKNIIVLCVKLIYCVFLKRSKFKKITSSLFYQLGRLRGLIGWRINIYHK